MGWQDIGDYKCVAENELGTAEKSVKIDVAGKSLFPPGSNFMLMGVNFSNTAALLICAVLGIFD